MHGIALITELNLEDQQIFKDNTTIFLSGTTKVELNTLLNEGDIWSHQLNIFYNTARLYFRRALVGRTLTSFWKAFHHYLSVSMLTRC